MMKTFDSFLVAKYGSLEEAKRIYLYSTTDNPNDEVNKRIVLVTPDARMSMADIAKDTKKHIRPNMVDGKNIGGVFVGNNLMLRYGEVSKNNEKKLKAEYDARRKIDIPERNKMTSDALKIASAKAKYTEKMTQNILNKIKKK